MGQPSDASLNDLQLSVSQVKPADVPTLRITVKNTNSKIPFTILTWNSPLDPLLVQLGLATITLPGSSTPLDIPTIMVKRLMPPPEGSLITLEPGEEASRTLELSERFVTPEQWKADGTGGRAKMQLKGRWTAIWPGVRKDGLIGTRRLEMLGHDAEGVLSGEYESETVEVDV